MLEYKGYISEVSHDEATGLLHARAVNSGSYPAANAEAAGLERELRRSIDVYLNGCKELQIDPISPASSAASRRTPHLGLN